MKWVVRSPYIVAFALAVLALAYRLVLLQTTLATVDSDEAVLGIMSRHILQGDRPVFFYGQSYQGALEAYLTAGAFRLWGQSDLTLRLAPTLVSVLLVIQLYGLARRLYGPRVALATGLWLALPAPVLAYWGTFAGAGYVEVVLLGTALCSIAIRRWGLARPRGYDWPVLGLLTGLGVWVQPLILHYVVLILAGALLAWRSRSSLTSQPHPGEREGTPATPLARAQREGQGVWGALLRNAVPALACFLLGGAPLMGYALRHGAASFGVLGGHFAPGLLLDTIRRLGSEAMPVLAGGALPFIYANDFARYVGTHALTYALAVLLICYLGVRLIVAPNGLVAQARAFLAGRPLPDALLALLLPVTLLLYLASRFEALPWTTHNPRYLLSLYTVTPYLIACAVPRMAVTPTIIGRLRRTMPAARPAWHVPRRRAMAARDSTARPMRVPALAAVLAVALATNVYGATQFQAPPRVTPLAATLLGRGDGAVYCLYWLAWRLAFESGERLTPVVTRGLAVDARSNNNRYPPYLALAVRARRWVYILPYDVDAPALVTLLRRHHVAYSRWRWGNASVFDGPATPGFPPTLSAGRGSAPSGIAAAATR